MNLLYELTKRSARRRDPHFFCENQWRIKMGLFDMIEFVANALKSDALSSRTYGRAREKPGSILMIVAPFGLSAVALSLIFTDFSKTAGLTLLVTLSLVITVQSIFATECSTRGRTGE